MSTYCVKELENLPTKGGMDSIYIPCSERESGVAAWLFVCCLSVVLNLSLCLQHIVLTCIGRKMCQYADLAFQIFYYHANYTLVTS